MISLGNLIYHEFHPFLVMVYKCFRIYLLWFKVFSKQLQVSCLIEGNDAFRMLWSTFTRIASIDARQAISIDKSKLKSIDSR